MATNSSVPARLVCSLAVQVAVAPPQTPAQYASAEPAPAWADRVTSPGGKSALQVPGQEMPGGCDATTPEPGPGNCTVRRNVPGAGPASGEPPSGPPLPPSGDPPSCPPCPPSVPGPASCPSCPPSVPDPASACPPSRLLSTPASSELEPASEL